RDPSPIAARAEHVRLRARFDALVSTHALASALGGSESEGLDPTIEDALETGRHADAAEAIGRELEAATASLAGRIIGENHSGRPGYLVMNPVGVSRRVAVVLPDADPDLRPEGPLRVAQFT